MKNKSRWRLKYAWWPIREVRHSKEGPSWEYTGRYYWLKNVYMVNNVWDGWIAFEKSADRGKPFTL